MMKKSLIILLAAVSLFMTGCGIIEDKPCNHEYKSSVMKEASCNEKGEIFYECKKCDHAYLEKTEVLDHEYTEERIEGSCVSATVINYKCSLCGDSYTEEIPAKGHNYGVEAPGLTDKCVVCSQSSGADELGVIEQELNTLIADLEKQQSIEEYKKTLDAAIFTTHLEEEFVASMIAEYDVKIAAKQNEISVFESNADTAGKENATLLLNSFYTEKTSLQEKITAISENRIPLLEKAEVFLDEIKADAANQEAYNTRISEIEAETDTYIKEMISESSYAAEPSDTRVFPIDKNGYKFISSSFGRKTVSGSVVLHRGIDYAASYGTSVYSSMNGTVLISAWNYAYGNYVVIDHGNGSATVYAHLGYAKVEAGDEVKQGEIIGSVGISGNSADSHLHFEFRNNGEAEDPKGFINI